MYAVSTTHVKRYGLTFHSRFSTIQELAHSLNAQKMAVDKILTNFNDTQLYINAMFL